MNPNLTTIPPSFSGLTINPNSTTLFSSIGFFWSRMFQDIGAVNGMTMAQADSVLQGYYKLIELVNAYSCYNIPVFETRRWYPLFVYNSSFSNPLVCGEGVAFGATSGGNPYLCGSAIPSATAGYVSMQALAELQAAPIIVDQVISPKHTLINGTDFWLANGVLTFKVNPFSYGNIPVQTVFNSAGAAQTYTYYNDLGVLSSPLPEQFIILWVETASIDSDLLDDNIGYLFGLNVPHNQNGKDILTAVVQNYTNGCTNNDIKALALASVGLTPYNPDPVSGQPVFQENTSYVQLFDNVNTPGWWNSDLALFSGTQIPLQLPQTMFYGTYKYGVQFVNSATGYVHLSSTGAITFDAGMVLGCASDIALFEQSISTPAFLAVLQAYLAANSFPVLTTSVSVHINLVNFLFQCFLKTSTALLRVKFTSADELGDFITYFNAIRCTLPPHIFLMVLCDFTVANETCLLPGFLLDNQTYTDPSLTAVVSNGTVTSISVNSAGSGFNSTIPDIIIDPPTIAVATGTANLTSTSVSSISITRAGHGYVSSAPPVITIGPPNTGTNNATATATISFGVVSGIIMTNTGSGYTTVPQVTIAAPLFQQAYAQATLNSGGTGIASIAMTNQSGITTTSSGMGYVAGPNVYVKPPGTVNLTNGIITGYSAAYQSGLSTPYFNDSGFMNNRAGSGLLVKDMSSAMSLAVTYAPPLKSEDVRNISFNVSS